MDLSQLLPWGYLLLLSCVGNVVYWALFLALKRVFPKEKLAGLLLQGVQLPLLFLFMELIFLLFFTDQQLFTPFFHHSLVVITITTCGWLFTSSIRVLYYYQVRHFQRFDQRALLTQALFLYRFALTVIMMITLATILMTFPYIRNLGIGLLSSAGIIGIALGMAGRPILLNFMASFQLALSKTIKIGDLLYHEGENLTVEEIKLTHVVAKTWGNQRYFIIPLSNFIDQTFQTWDLKTRDLFASFTLYCDYSVSIDEIRKKIGELLTITPLWNGKEWRVDVVDCKENMIEIRVAMSVDHPEAAFDLQNWMREQLINYLKQVTPNAFPCIRNIEISTEEGI